MQIVSTCLREGQVNVTMGMRSFKSSPRTTKFTYGQLKTCLEGCQHQHRDIRDSSKPPDLINTVNTGYDQLANT